MCEEHVSKCKWKAWINIHGIIIKNYGGYVWSTILHEALKYLIKMILHENYKLFKGSFINYGSIKAFTLEINPEKSQKAKKTP